MGVQVGVKRTVEKWACNRMGGFDVGGLCGFVPGYRQFDLGSECQSRVSSFI